MIFTDYKKASLASGRCGLLRWPCQPDERLDEIGAMDGPYMQMNVK
jgi:hypothetical protein